MPRNFGLNQRNPDDGDPPLHWVDDHWEVSHQTEPNAYWVGYAVLGASLAVVLMILGAVLL